MKVPKDDVCLSSSICHPIVTMNTDDLSKQASVVCPSVTSFSLFPYPAWSDVWQNNEELEIPLSLGIHPVLFYPTSSLILLWIQEPRGEE